MNTHVIVRMARKEDFETVLPLAQAMATSFKVSEEDFRNSFYEVIGQDSSICLIAQKDGDIIGYLLGFDHKAFYANGRVSWVEEIFVLEEHRKEGAGKLLMDSFERWCRDRHSKLISLATRRAADFYKAIGYSESAIYFRKVLPQPVAGGDATR